MEHTTEFPSPSERARRDMLAVAVRAKRAELELSLQQTWPDLAVTDLRPAQSGLVMLRGRIGGDGAPFNLGEASMSRAAVALETGEIGYGHVLGRDTALARMIAVVDALWQRDFDRTRIEQSVLAPIRARLRREMDTEQGKTAATRVDFFTLVRGED